MTVRVVRNPPADVPEQIKVDNNAIVGGEGAIYFSKDGKFAVKIYH